MHTYIDVYGMWTTSAIFVCQVREAPDVAKADSEADAGEDELELTSPRSSFRVVCVDDLNHLRSFRCFRLLRVLLPTLRL